MKTSIRIHENEQWVEYSKNSHKIEHVNVTTKGECFFFDPVSKSATAVIPQPPTPEDPRAGHLMVCLKFDEDEFDWFWDKLSRIKGLRDWLKNISRVKAKQYALESMPFPKTEIEERANAFDEKADSLSQTEKEIALQFMAAIITMQTVKPDIFAAAKKQRDDLIIQVLKSLPKEYRKVKIAMPWSSGLDLGKISITDEDKLPDISNPLYVINETSTKIKEKFPDQFDVAKMFYNNPGLADKLELSDVINLAKFYKKVPENVKLDYWLAIYFFQKGVPEYENLEWNKLVEIYEFCEKTPEAKHLEPKLVLASIEFYKELLQEYPEIKPQDIWDYCNSYKDLIAAKNLGWKDILTKSFYNDFHKRGSVQNLKPVMILDLFKFCEKVSAAKKNKLPEILTLDFYGFFAVVREDSSVKPDTVLDLYGFYKQLLTKYAGLKPQGVLNYYDFYKNALAAKSLELGYILNLEFFEFHQKFVQKDSKIAAGVVLVLHKFSKEIGSEEESVKIYDLYKDIIVAKNLRWEDVLTKSFYDNFHKNGLAQNLELDMILDLFKQFRANSKSELSLILTLDFYGFFDVARKYTGITTRLLVDLYKFYKNEKLRQKYPDIKPVEVLDYYNFYKEPIYVLTSDFYEFHKDFVQKNKNPGLTYIFKFYEFCHADYAQPLLTDLNCKFYKFYVEFAVQEEKNLQADKNVKPSIIQKFLPRTDKNLKTSEILTQKFYSFYKKYVFPAAKDSFTPADVSNFYNFYIKIVSAGRDVEPLFFMFYAELIPILGMSLEANEISNFYECYYLKALDLLSKGLHDKAMDVFKSVKSKKDPKVAGKIINVFEQLHPFEKKSGDAKNNSDKNGISVAVEVGENKIGIVPKVKKTESDNIRHGENTKNKQNRPTPLYFISLLYLFWLIGGTLLYFYFNGNKPTELLSKYHLVQESMLQFMSDNNMIGSVFAYRPSNGDVYCMASNAGRTGSEVENKNLGLFAPGATIQPVTLLVMNDQEETRLKDFSFSGEKEDSYSLIGTSEKVKCSGSHLGKQFASDGLGNSCNSFFAMGADMLSLEEAEKMLEDMDFDVELYEKSPKMKEQAIRIGNNSYAQSFFPLEKKEHSRANIQNFIGEGSLLVSPIDMAVWTALFGKLSSDKNSKVYFPRIWLPANKAWQNEGFPELLLTDKNSTENEHIVKLSDFVSTHKESIAEVGRIWKKAYDEHYRNLNSTRPERNHLDGDGLTSWSQWIDMAKTGTVTNRPDETDPNYGKCLKEREAEVNGKREKQCVEGYKVKHRTQRNLSLYSEELDLAAYIVIENYSGAYVSSNVKLDSTSMMLTKLVAEVLGKKLNPEKQKIEDEQWNRFINRYKKSQEEKDSEEVGIETNKIDGLE